ncbi:MAG TPA: pyridoxal phosphate-dependent aminotransferase [Streptosporangiaceae bacterium]
MSLLDSPSSATLGAGPKCQLSATLAVNEVIAARRRRGEPALPLGFGEAGIPVHPALRHALADAAGCNSYGPVAGLPALREAAAGYWSRRGLPTDPDAVICGPGSKALLYGLVAAIGGDIAVTQPSWVSYAAQASLAGVTAHLIPGTSGVPDAMALTRAVLAARDRHRPIRAVIITLPDNPTGTLAAASRVRALCAVAERYDLVIISDEIYRDLVYDDGPAFETPCSFTSERTVVTSGLSKSLALGGWRLGVLRLPDGQLGHELRGRLLAIGSEIWSAPANPVQHAAAYAYGEPGVLTDHIARSRRLHAAVAHAVADRFAAAGASVPRPQAAFYVYPDFSPLADALMRRYEVNTDEGLADVLLHRYGVGVLPASAFGEQPWRLRLRVATAMLYGETDVQRESALAADDPCALPWIAATLDRIDEVLAHLTS